MLNISEEFVIEVAGNIKEQNRLKCSMEIVNILIHI